MDKNILQLEQAGYAVLNQLYTEEEIAQILDCIEKAEAEGKTAEKTKDVFAIRQLINTIPELRPLLFNEKLKELIATFSESTYFMTKAIYFDKPSKSNWFVGYHQDLSISVGQKAAVAGYQNWTFKKGQYGVQPPLEILKDTITVRIHLDDTNAGNGALRIRPKSHLHGVIRIDAKNELFDAEHICEVKKGAVMLMKPLILHASSRTTNGKQRRVIHLEFNRHQLANPLNWLEACNVF